MKNYDTIENRTRDLPAYSVASNESNTGYADCLLASSQHNLYDIYLLLCVQCQTPEDGQKTCPKHVEFYSKNKFEKLVHLVGFICKNTFKGVQFVFQHVLVFNF